MAQACLPTATEQQATLIFSTVAERMAMERSQAMWGSSTEGPITATVAPALGGIVGNSGTSTPDKTEIGSAAGGTHRGGGSREQASSWQSKQVSLHSDHGVAAEPLKGEKACGSEDDTKEEAKATGGGGLRPHAPTQNDPNSPQQPQDIVIQELLGEEKAGNDEAVAELDCLQRTDRDAIQELLCAEQAMIGDAEADIERAIPDNTSGHAEVACKIWNGVTGAPATASEEAHAVTPEDVARELLIEKVDGDNENEIKTSKTKPRGKLVWRPVPGPAANTQSAETISRRRRKAKQQKAETLVPPVAQVKIAKALATTTSRTSPGTRRTSWSTTGVDNETEVTPESPWMQSSPWTRRTSWNVAGADKETEVTPENPWTQKSPWTRRISLNATGADKEAEVTPESPWTQKSPWTRRTFLNATGADNETEKTPENPWMQNSPWTQRTSWNTGSTSNETEVTQVSPWTQQSSPRTQRSSCKAGDVNNQKEVTQVSPGTQRRPWSPSAASVRVNEQETPSTASRGSPFASRGSPFGALNGMQFGPRPKTLFQDFNFDDVDSLAKVLFPLGISQTQADVGVQVVSVRLVGQTQTRVEAVVEQAVQTDLSVADIEESLGHKAAADELRMIGEILRCQLVKSEQQVKELLGQKSQPMNCAQLLRYFDVNSSKVRRRLGSSQNWRQPSNCRHRTNRARRLVVHHHRVPLHQALPAQHLPPNRCNQQAHLRPRRQSAAVFRQRGLYIHHID